MSTPDTQASDAQDPKVTEEEVKQDTPETQETSEASELENQTPEATQEEEDKETSETEVKAEDTVEQELLAGKYKTPQDLEKAYKELESKFGKEASSRAELTKALNEVLTPSQEAPKQPAKETADTEDDLDYTPTQTDPALKEEVEALKRNDAILRFGMSHPDADGNTMKEVLTNDPMVSQMSSVDAKLEYAYLKSKNATSSQAVAEAEKSAQKQAQAKMAEKESAKVESGQQAEPVDEGAELMSKATEGTPEERKAARDAIIRKHLTNL